MTEHITRAGSFDMTWAGAVSGGMTPLEDVRAIVDCHRIGGMNYEQIRQRFSKLVNREIPLEEFEGVMQELDELGQDSR